MAIRITIASGKGGTGKTTLATNLFHHIERAGSDHVTLADCDVEEPNVLLFFPEAELSGSRTVNQEVPFIDTNRCTFCRKCSDFCEFGAILVMPPVGFAQVNPELCHSCGACEVACDQGAILVRDKPIGTIREYRSAGGNRMIEGRLNIGSPMQTMVIRQLKRSLPPDDDICLMDAPPGTSCPVVESIDGSDYVILVTEPTPFGLNDLQLMVSLVRELGIPFGVVVNKAGLGNDALYGYLEQEGIEILGEIPFSRQFASRYAGGKLFTEIPEEMTGCCEELLQRIHGTIDVQ
jgi:MinD superfamily P-loop ATPase